VLYSVLRAALFRLDPELSHDITMPLMNLCCGNALVRPWLTRRRVDDPVKCMGLTFPNRIGLAAGLDKNADYIDGLGALGFGFIEVGTVTPRPQPGNPKPRLFRLRQEQAIINRMGFNNKGVDHLIAQVAKRRYQGILGINIGKNADTPLERANDDYVHCLQKVYPHADYITVNISSPNTPGLRQLQHGDLLAELFGSLKENQIRLQKQHGCYTPIAVKIAPDMSPVEIDAFARQAIHYEIDGIIATNTTFSRDGVETSPQRNENGGLSGRPLCERSTTTVRQLGTRLADQIPIIGVGGIHSVADAEAKLAAGATLIQVYSGLVYEGPALVRSLTRALAQSSHSRD